MGRRSGSRCIEFIIRPNFLTSNSRYIRDRPMEFFDDSMKRWYRALIRYEKENGEI